MDQIIASPTPSPIPLDIALPSGMDWGSIVQSVLGMVSGITQNPITALVGVGGVAVVLAILYFFIRAKLNAWEIAKAKAATDAGKAQWVDVNTGTNAGNAKKDNDGRAELDKLP